jgi:hypothetical protein
MSIPTPVFVIFTVIGFVFMLLGPFTPTINLIIFLIVIFFIVALGAAMGMMYQYFLGGVAVMELPKKRQRGDPVDDKEIVEGFVTIGDKSFAVIDGHVNGKNMTKHEYQDYMNDVTQARDEESGKVRNLPVCNTSYRMTPGDPTAGGHNGDWRDEA